MAENRYPQHKIDTIRELEELIRGSKSVFLTDYKGLNVELMNKLRGKLFQQDIVFRIAKNTLSRIAMRNCGYSELDDELIGPIALAFGKDDPSTPAKIIMEFARENKLPQLKSCVFEGRIYDSTKMDMIKSLPTRQQALSLLIGQIEAPLSHFVGLLNEIIRSLLAVIDAIIEQTVKN